MAKTTHTFYVGDTGKIIKKIPKETVQLIITSPPYWNAKNYNHKKQLGYYDTFKDYLRKLRETMNEMERVLVPDGKIAINIGNIYNADNKYRRHYTINLIQDIWDMLYSNEKLRFMGTIYWKKTTSRNGAVLFGSYPYPSNFMISTALEAIHIFRKIGKRKVEKGVKQKSKITKKEFRELREPIWYLNGISKKEHPAVFPDEMVNRLIKMYSFVGDTVLDPFCGIGTTNLETLKLNRNSIGIDIRTSFVKHAIKKVKRISNKNQINITFNTE